jgi:hypothetical protein
MEHGVDPNTRLHSYRPDLTHSERWVALRETVTRLYMREGRTKQEVLQVLREEYGFDAE